MASTQPRKRIWLYAPYVIALLGVVGWAAFWFIVKDRVATGVDGWMVKEAQAGRMWRCDNRSIAGFPFRIELKCAGISLSRTADASAPLVTAGPLLVVAQIYDPNHLIAEPKGPITSLWVDGRRASVSWEKAQISLRRSSSQFERGSFVADAFNLTLAGFDNADGSSKAVRVAAHIRPMPNRASEAAFDIALNIDKLGTAVLDQLFSSVDPADVKIEASLTQMASLLGGVTPVTLETWRVAGGAVDLTKLSLSKGKAVFEGQAKLALDELRRVRGRLDGAQIGIDSLGGMRIGAILDAGALFSGRAASQTQGGLNLKPLPPLEARDGRLFLGPLRLPGAPLKPVY